jgi:hypothetical protein
MFTTILKNMAKRRLGPATAIMAAMSCALVAQAQTPITACGTLITTPGDYYLYADLSCAGTAVTIQSSNVSLRLSGRKITPLIPVNTPAIQAGMAGRRFHHITVSGPSLISDSGPYQFYYGVSHAGCRQWPDQQGHSHQRLGGGACFVGRSSQLRAGDPAPALP